MKTHTARAWSVVAGTILAALTVLPAARADYSSTVLSQGPVGYWRLNETVTPQSYAGAANLGSLGASALGTYNNYPLRGLAGPFAGSAAVGLDGGSQSVTTGWQSALNTTTFSFESWLNPGVVPKFAYVASSAHLASPRSGWYLAQDDGSTFGHGSAYVVRLFYQNGTTPAITLWTPVSAPGWVHLVLTCDGTTATLYTNGAVAMSGTVAGYVGNVDQPTSIGCRSDNNYYWPGQQAEVAMYNVALSGPRVAAHYTAATTAPATYASTVQADAPVLYYRFQEATDPVAANSGTLGSAGNGLYFYDAKPGATGPTPPTFPGFDSANKAVTFDAGSGAVRLPGLNLNTNTVTISGWFKAVGSQPTRTGLVICNSGSTVAGLTIDQSYAGYGLGYIWDGNNYGWSPTSDFGLPGLPDSTWAYAALVIQPTSATLYICDANNYGNWASLQNTYGVSHAVQSFSGPTLIGTEAGFTDRSFNGAIDEVAIFNRALSAGELYTAYASSVGGVPPRIFTDLQGPSGVIPVGDPIVLTVDAGGSPALSYAWHKDGSTIATTTSGTFTIASAALSDSGTYDVTVSNGSGSAPSQSVVVSVITPSQPTILSSVGFTNRPIYPGGTLNLSVNATGGGLHYQWYKNAAPIASATRSAFTIASVTNSDAGSYTVSVTNSVGNASMGPAVITVPSSTTGSYEALVLSSAPEAWWRLNETPGSPIMWDAMARHDGYYTNLNATVPPVALGAAGALANDPDTAVTISPATMGAGVADFSSALNSPQFTVEAWVKTSNLSDGLVPVSSTDGSGGWWWQTTGGNWAGYGPSGYAPIFDYNPTAVMSPGQWTHLVITYDGNRILSGTHYPYQYFINGQGDGYVWTGSMANTAGPFLIGAHYTSSAFADHFFDGQVDEVALYGRLLTTTEIANHFNGRFGANTLPYFVGTFLPQTVTTGKSISFSTSVYGSVPIKLQWFKNNAPIPGATTSSFALTNTAVTDTATYTLWATNGAGTASQSVTVTVISPVAYAQVTNGLVLHLKFDGDTLDASGRGNNGAPVNSPTFVPGLVGSQALQYTTITVTNGSSTPSNVTVSAANYVNLGAPADLQFGAATSFSVGLWVKLPVGFSGGDLPFIGSATNSNNNLGWDLSPTYGGGGWQWCLDDGVHIQDVNGPSDSINDGAWHHVVLTVDRAAKVASSYVDGVLFGTRDISSLGSIDTSGPIVIGQDPTGLYGQLSPASQNDLTVWGPPQTATLDDLGIWRRALTALEVAEMQSAGLTAGHSFDMPDPTPRITLTRSGSSITLSWPAGTLLQSTTLGPGAVWTPVPGAAAPSYTFTPGPGQQYFRVRLQ